MPPKPGRTYVDGGFGTKNNGSNIVPMEEAVGNRDTHGRRASEGKRLPPNKVDMKIAHSSRIRRVNDLDRRRQMLMEEIDSIEKQMIRLGWHPGTGEVRKS
jgi:hypothetical protein